MSHQSKTVAFNFKIIFKLKSQIVNFKSKISSSNCSLTPDS